MVSASGSHIARYLGAVTGTRNKSALGWVEANRDLLDAAGVEVEIVAGLTHDQESTQVDRVFPAVSSFLLGEKD